MHYRLRAAMVCALAALPWLVRAAAAQAPAERAALAHLLDSTIPSPSAPSSSTSLPYSALLRGIELLRSARAGGGRDMLDAAQAAFDEAIYRAPDNWPWPWYGLALTDLALDSSGFRVKPSQHQPAGTSYRHAAILAAAHALKADSSFAPAAELLATLLLPPSQQQSLDPAVEDAVRRAEASAQTPVTHLAYGRMQRALEHPDSALQAFRRYLHSTTDSATAYLAIARALSALGHSADANVAYFAGAGLLATPAGRAAYHRDLAWVATDAELVAFDLLPATRLQAWIAGFWAKRDAAELAAPGAVLTEHFRRWHYVFENFQVVGRKDGVNFGAYEPDPLVTQIRNSAFSDYVRFDNAGVFSAISHGQRVIDDRGVIYMRHGAPDKVAQKGVYMAWKYFTTTGALIFQFGPSSVLGMEAPTTLVIQFPLDEGLLGAMMGLDSRYELVAGQLRDVAMARHLRELSSQAATENPSPGRSYSRSGISAGLVQKLNRTRERDLRVGLTTDGFPPHFKHQLEPAAQFFAVGTPGRVLVVFALPGDKLEHITLPDGGAGYPVVLRIIATNAAGQIARMDTTRRFRSDQPLAEGQYLFGLEELKLAPGTWDVRLLVTEPEMDAGGAIGRIGVTVPSTSRLGLSDLVLGREGAGLTWRSPAGTIPLNPLDAFPPRGSAELYYELHGATPDSTYQTDIEVKGVYGDAKGTVHLTFSEQARGAVVRVRRSIGLDQLETGQYLVTVTVTEQGTGRTAVQQRYLNVRE
jgi:tetratricopeptide (TPR) repeat protein